MKTTRYTLLLLIAGGMVALAISLLAYSIEYHVTLAFETFGAALLVINAASTVK